MVLILKEILIDDFNSDKNELFKLIDSIWANQKSATNTKHSIQRWAEAAKTNKPESGNYFYIILDGLKVGLTGYFIPDKLHGTFGLRHHGTTVKGTGKLALDLLVAYLKDKYGKGYKQLVELVPAEHPEIIDKFKSWGFELSDGPIPDWEPKRNYYKYVMYRSG
ncbi:hypothetical protein J4438_02265 [Candidatus Woesearchaeota archaeon]|nr:hypothetical protein [Candidatus Woesearchaeota archaeon]